MVDWTDKERSIITGLFSNLDYEDIGAKALSRFLIVYPWAQRYFSSFGMVNNPEAIKSNPNVAALGWKILQALDRGVKNMDNIKTAYMDLNARYSERIRVHPDNFTLLSECLTYVIGAQMGKSFTAELQAAFQKFMEEVQSALTAK